MTSRKQLAGLLLLVAAMTASSAEVAAPKTDWLVGTWVLCDDPDHSPKDTLQFKADGTGTVTSTKGSLGFTHNQSGRSVSLLASANGYTIPIEMSASPALDRLLLHSDKTGNTASYVRSDSAAVGRCSIQ